MTTPYRLPLKITEHEEAFGITDAAGKSVAWIYFDDGCPVRRSVRKRMTKDEAVETAKAIARALTERAKEGEDDA